jgi:hypothetical protein
VSFAELLAAFLVNAWYFVAGHYISDMWHSAFVNKHLGRFIRLTFLFNDLLFNRWPEFVPANLFIFWFLCRHNCINVLVETCRPTERIGAKTDIQITNKCHLQSYCQYSKRHKTSVIITTIPASIWWTLRISSIQVPQFRRHS